VAAVDINARLRHDIRLQNEAGGKARPFGVIGAEIWHKVGSPPAGPADCTFLATTTRSTHLAEYDDGDGGKSVYYITRWINSRGETGPWSETVAATIAA